MVDKAQMAAQLSDKELDRAADSVIKYLAGEEQSPDAAKAARALLNTMPKDELDKLQDLSRKATKSPPQFKPGEMVGIHPDYLKLLAQEQDAARDSVRDTLRTNSDGNPAVKEKLIELIEKSPQQPDRPSRAPSRFSLEEALSLKEPLAVEQQQAYLKVMGYNIGKSGLTGKAGQGSMTQKALDEFAKKSGVDPKDTDAVQKALLKAVQKSPEANILAERTQKALQSGAPTKPEDVKTLQWITKGNGAAMPNSLKDGRMDGIAGIETKTQLGLYMDKTRSPEYADTSPPTASPFDRKLKLFRDNIGDIITDAQRTPPANDPKADKKIGSSIFELNLDKGDDRLMAKTIKLVEFQDTAREVASISSGIAEPDNEVGSAPKTVRPISWTTKGPV